MIYNERRKEVIPIIIDIEKIKYHNFIYNGPAYSVLKFIDNKWVFEEQDLLEYTLDYLNDIDKPCLLDIGASIGDFCLLPIYNKDMTCYSFEPNPVLYRLLVKHIEMNNLKDNVLAYKYAICDRDENISFYVSKNPCRCGQSCIDNKPIFKDGFSTKNLKVKGMKLDTFVKENNIPKIDMIKIDVEGAELKVLNGAIETLNRCDPLILIEVHENNLKRFDLSTKDLYNRLEGLGYKLKEKIGDKDEVWIKQ